jgi:hypothetical protein
MEADPAPLRDPEPPVAEVAAAVIDLATACKRKATRRAYTAAAVGSMVLGTAGVAAAAQSALPGSPLYGIKRAIESVELSFATSDNARGQDLLDQARTRLSEVKALSAQGSGASNTELIQQTLQAFASSASQGTNLLFTSYQRQGDVSDLSVIQSFASSAASQLNSMSPSFINQNRAQMLEASSLIANVEQQSKLLCPTCAALPPLTEQYQKLAASQSSAGVGALLAAPEPTVQVKTPTPAHQHHPVTPSQPTKPVSTPTGPSQPPVTVPPTTGTDATTAVSRTLNAVVKPVTTTLTTVLQVTTNTVGGLTNTVGSLLGGLTGHK